jgi:ferredoxin
MATIITSECINCGACEPECPNTAIYQGGVDWDHNGANHSALSQDIFYIVPEKCTECVGFFDQEACAAVCPVDCCVPDPDRPESEEALLARARELHPETPIAEDFPSRFRKKEPAPPVAVPAATAPAVVAGAPGPAAPVITPAPVLVGGRVERALPRLRGAGPAPPVAPPRPPKQFPGELDEAFDDVLGSVMFGRSARGAGVLRLAVRLLQPFLGAGTDAAKRGLERAVGDRAVFGATRATVRNGLGNMVLYPVLGMAVAVILRGENFFSSRMDVWIFLGMTLGACEWMARMRESIFAGMPAEDAPLRGALYAPLANAALGLVARVASGQSRQSRVAFDGFYDRRFDDKTDRERRYGEVYRVDDLSGGYLLRLEFPQQVPASSLAEELGLTDQMPDYDYDIALHNGHLVIRGSVTDPRARKLTAVAAAFPPEFTTRVPLARPVIGFRHRYRDKVLEVALPARR